MSTDLRARNIALHKRILSIEVFLFGAVTLVTFKRELGPELVFAVAVALFGVYALATTIALFAGMRDVRHGALVVHGATLVVAFVSVFGVRFF